MRRKNFKFFGITLCKWIGQILFIGLALIFVFNFPAPAEAASASLYLTPSTGTYSINSKFSIAVKVNSGGQVINAAEGAISFDSNLLEVIGISKSGTIFPYWTTEPSFSNSAGTISFGGGLPPPAYSGTAGHICSITFKAKRSGGAQVRFSSGAVLAHDGKGTNVLASMGSGSFTISPYVAAPKSTFPEIEPEEEYNKPKITSPTHPDQNAWYSNNNVQFKWELPEGAKGVSIDFNREPVSDPGPVADGLFAEKEYETTEDGVWYLHLKFKDHRRWGTIAHFRVMVDTTPPLPFEIEVRKIEVGDWPELHFEAKDEGSGIKHYEVIIGSLESEAQIVEAEKALYKVSGLEVGEHTVQVKAVDKAGNEIYAQAKFVIEPIEAPVVTNYAHELKSTDQFFMNGTALADVTINVFIQKEEKVIITDSVKSDSNGSWFYINKERLENNRYIVWVEAVNDKGIKSGPSNKISFLVTPPVFARLGSWVINYFTVLVSLLFMIILIILLILYLAGKIRKRLKKETGEVEQVLHKNFINLKKAIDKEFIDLNKLAGTIDYNKERVEVKQRLKRNIDGVEKKIAKEIKDVEEILK